MRINSAGPIFFKKFNIKLIIVPPWRDCKSNYLHFGIHVTLEVNGHHAINQDSPRAILAGLEVDKSGDHRVLQAFGKGFGVGH